MSMNINKCNPDTAFETLLALYPLRTKGVAVMMHGAPGVGKSSVARRLAKAIDGEFIDFRLAQMPAEDLRGLPKIDEERGVSRYIPPEDLPRSGRGVILLDEITGADARVQNAALELVLDRRMGRGYKVPDDYMILAAGNGAEHGAHVFELSTPLADRFTHIEVVADAEQWLSYADRVDMHPSVQTFIKTHPHYLDGIELRVREQHIAGPSPRGWETVSDFIKTIHDQKILQTAIAGKIGTAAATDFTQVMAELSSYADAIAVMKAEGDRLMQLLPKTLNGLYGLVFGLRSQIQDIASARKVFGIMLKISDIEVEDTTVPLAEVQRLGCELAMQKIWEKQLINLMISTPEYLEFKAREEADKAAQATA